VKHFASRRFWRLYDALPADIRAVADKNHQLLKADPAHPSLHFKKIGKLRSARVGIHHRALAVEVEGVLGGSGLARHDEYERLIAYPSG
jgi:hypothetical protein